MIKYLFITVYFIIFFSSAQEKDSLLIHLEKQLHSSRQDTTKVNAMLKLGSYQLDHDIKQAENILKNALALMNNTKQTIKTEQLATLYGQLGVVYKRKGDYPLALKHYLKSKTYYEQLNDTSNVANIYHNMAMLHRDQRNYSKAILLFRKAIKLKRTLKEEKGIAIAYNMLGVVYRKNRQLDSALIYYNKAKSIFTRINNKTELYRVNSNLAALYHYQKKYQTSIDLHLDNIKYYEKENRRTSLFSSNYNIAKTYSLVENYNKALKHLDKALSIAIEDSLKDKIARAYLRKSFINATKGNYKLAYESHIKYKKYSDSVYNKENIEKIKAIELNHKFDKEKLSDSLKFEREKKELELINTSEKSRKQLYFILFLLSVIAAIAIGILIKKSYKNKVDLAKHQLLKKQQELKVVYSTNAKKSKEQEILAAQHEQLIKELGEKVAVTNLQELIGSKILTKQDWFNFKQKFSLLYPNFYKNISKQGYKLTNSEERLITLEKLGLKSDEIANMLGISFDSVVMNRYRLRKKLNAPNDISILEFLENKAQN